MPYCVSQQELDLSRHEIVSGPHIGGCPDCDSSTSSGSIGLSSDSSASSGNSSTSSDSSNNSAQNSSNAGPATYTISGGVSISVVPSQGVTNCAGLSLGVDTGGQLSFNGAVAFGNTVTREGGGAGPQVTVTGSGGVDSFGFPQTLDIVFHYGGANGAPGCICQDGTAWSGAKQAPQTSASNNSAMYVAGGGRLCGGAGDYQSDILTGSFTIYRFT